MIKLFADTAEQSEPVVPIRWCISKSVLDTLKDRDVAEPFLFLSIEHENRGEVDRRLIRLDQMMEYLQFNHAGKHTVHATVVYPFTDEHSSHFRNNILTRNSSTSFIYTVYNLGGKFEGSSRLSQLPCVEVVLGEETSLDVNIGQEFFAKEPPAWLRGWVNLWYEYAPRDQCAFRRRMILAFTAQPPLVMLWVLLFFFVRTLYASMALLWGVRGVKLAPIIHPLRDDTNDVVGGAYARQVFLSANENFFTSDKRGDRRSGLFILLHPLILAPLATATYFISRFNLWPLVLLGLSGAVAGTVVGWALTSFTKMVLRDAKKEKKEKTPTLTLAQREYWARRRAEEARAAALEEFYTTELHQVVCEGTPLRAAVSALPKSRQTFTLRFKEVKAKVCRPFAHG